MQHQTINRSARSRTLVTIVVCAVLIALAVTSRDGGTQLSAAESIHWTLAPSG